MDHSQAVQFEEGCRCEICNTKSRQYTCPRCGINYCSMECYKSSVHLDCSESFYKECVEEELAARTHEPGAKRNMLEILKRMHEEECNDNVHGIEEEAEVFSLDSDDEEDIPDLEERLRSINLDNTDAVWHALTEGERQEFESLVRNGEVEKLVPRWEPWWTYQAEKKLVYEVEEHNSVPEYVKKCPEILEVPQLNGISKAAYCVRYNVLNVLYAYAYTVLHFNGDHHDSASEAVKVFLQLCGNMQNGQVYENSEAALKSVLHLIAEYPQLPQDEETLLTIQTSGSLLVRGPEEDNRCFYMSAALSDLHNLFLAAIIAKQTLSTSQQDTAKVDHKFSKFDHYDSKDCDFQVSKKHLRLYLKKLEYYLCWVKNYGEAFAGTLS